jgi:GTPase SAR1 family protein
MMGWKFENGSKPTFAVSSCHHKSSYQYKEYDMKVDYEIFDTPGLDRFADIITLYLRGALALIVVYDVCNRKSFEKAKWWINYLEDNASGYDKIILVANKIDIKDQLDRPGADGDGEQDDDDEDGDDDDDDVIDDGTTAGKDGDDDDEDEEYDIIKAGRLYATERGISFLEISAKTKDNIAVLNKWLNKQSKKKVARNPQLLEKKDQAIQLHEGLLNGSSHNRGTGLLQKLDNFEFDYSKCCAL